MLSSDMTKHIQIDALFWTSKGLTTLVHILINVRLFRRVVNISPLAIEGAKCIFHSFEENALKYLVQAYNINNTWRYWVQCINV